MSVVSWKSLHTAIGPTLRLFTASVFCIGTLSVAATTQGSDIELVGIGTFKPPSSESLAALPAGLPFPAKDLATGTWSVHVVYDALARDFDPDPYVGRYSQAIKSFRLKVGATTLDLPPSSAEILVSDGGMGIPHREAIRVQAHTPTPLGRLRVSWNQVNQSPNLTDLRGSTGLLAGDGLPAAGVVASLPTASPFDRFLLLQVDPRDGGPVPLLYISSSTLSVVAAPVQAH